MNGLYCPYCKKDVDDPDDCYNTDERYDYECPHCEKTFLFTLDYTTNYHPIKADCLNGGEHTLHLCLECSGCGKTVKVDKIEKIDRP